MNSEIRLNSSMSSVLSSLSASDSVIDALGVILYGNSVIDFRRLNFKSDTEIDNFLRLNNFNLDESRSYRRIYHIYNDAINYLTSLGIDIPQEFRDIRDIKDLFRYSSYLKGSKTLSHLSCSILKVMHILHHLESRELMYRLGIPVERLFSMCEERVSLAVSKLNSSGISIYHYSTSRDNIFDRITRLTAKKEVIAAQQFEKASFDIVTERKEEILPVLKYLISNVFPFNYVVPGYSSSNYIDLLSELRSDEEYSKKIDVYQFTREIPKTDSRFGCVYMKVDIPLDVSLFGFNLDEETIENLGFTVFSLTEFIITDVNSRQRAEEGRENSLNQRLLLKREAITRLTQE